MKRLSVALSAEVMTKFEKLAKKVNLSNSSLGSALITHALLGDDRVTPEFLKEHCPVEERLDWHAQLIEKVLRHREKMVQRIAQAEQRVAGLECGGVDGKAIEQEFDRLNEKIADLEAKLKEWRDVTGLDALPSDGVGSLGHQSKAIGFAELRDRAQRQLASQAQAARNEKQPVIAKNTGDKGKFSSRPVIVAPPSTNSRQRRALGNIK